MSFAWMLVYLAKNEIMFDNKGQTGNDDATPDDTFVLPACGNGVCEGNESCSTCMLDCGFCCGNRRCDNEENCTSCQLDCGACPHPITTFNYAVNDEPYYALYCDKIDPYNLQVREAAAKAIKNHTGEYSPEQLFDVYDWVKRNVDYQNVAASGAPFPAQETLATGSGDCKNQAVLIASMIQSIGGTAKVIADPDCSHAYAIVLFGAMTDDYQGFPEAFAQRYGPDIPLNTIKNGEGTWVIFDPAGGSYPGNTLPECSGKRNVFLVDTCLSCAHQYPTMPYSYKTKCYSRCPSGTISNTRYTCAPCDAGHYSYENQCYSACPAGTVHDDNYGCNACPAGHWVYDNKCATCPAGYTPTTDGKCRPA